MKKYRPPLNPAEKAELQRLSCLDFSSYSETDVREEFLVELLKLLGYRKDLDYSVSREQSFELNPFFLSVGSKRVRLDYICSLRKQYFWIIDAKEGICKDNKTPPAIAKESIAQAHFYSLHPEINCRYFIVSNGWFTNLYERDTLDENGTPILSIKSSEMAERFLELDGFVGATQILPFLKNNILREVEKILSSEIWVDRLDEFVDEVRKVTAKVRGSVQRAGVTNIFTSGNLSRQLDHIATGNLTEQVYTLFEAPRSKLEMNDLCKRVLNRLKDNDSSPHFSPGLFYSKLILQNPLPVSFWYYINVLNFLLEASKLFPDKRVYQQFTISDLTAQWIDLTLFGLSKRSELRYMWCCERLYVKIMKQMILMLPTMRKDVTDALKQHAFFLDEELLNYFVLSEASILGSSIDKLAAHFRSEFLRKFFDSERHKFKVNMAQQHYESLKEISLRWDFEVGNRYKEMKKELGNSWGDLLHADDLNYDMFTSGICAVLDWHRESLSMLTEKQKLRLKLIAEVGCANYADKVCGALSMNYSPDLSTEAKDELKAAFFDPGRDQY